ncbi:copper homeostasis protein CutC [Paenibacillus sp. MWE-103]|uniref:PF03932 family protein CutC n=1 Tax=Paenibacillus artemisiicola TaxID=1172618 RepID=A0ABS3W4N9_9BACL|nr:copper homeostasis protein CutC [Paenibacillus artemisiicola]MBO7743263.1 copper homeostasis protein CutC [Paenibacillus artemisiicola]
MRIEVIATSGDDVIRACSGGADRIELVTGILEGGLTPSLGLLDYAASHADIPVHVMIRPHSRSFRYDASDLLVMRRDIREARRAGAAGIVIGALTPEGRVDRTALLPLLEEAEGMNVTFHRAFDEARDLDEALDDVLLLPRVNRILTSGGQASAADAADVLARLSGRLAGSDVRVLAGSGLTPTSIGSFMARSGVREVHFGRGVRTNGSYADPIDPAIIRSMKQRADRPD